MKNSLKNKRCVIPVSYTHLDVYKRQTLYCLKVKISPFVLHFTGLSDALLQKLAATSSTLYDMMDMNNSTSNAGV